MVIDRTNTQLQLGLLLGRIREVMSAAFDRYLALDPAVRASLSPRSIASITHDFIIENALRLLADAPGVTWELRGGLFLAYIETEWVVYVLRFKKLDQRLRFRGIATRQYSNFVNQIQPSLPGLGLIPLSELPFVNLVAGYILNELRTELESVHMVCPGGKEHRWTFEILRQEELGVLTIPSAGVPQPTRPRVAVRGEAVADQGVGSE